MLSRAGNFRLADSLLIIIANYLTKLSRDIILPVIPLLATDFSISTNYARSIITVYFIGIAASRFIWSFAADRFNRKPLLIVLHFAFIIATLIALSDAAYEFLLVSRFIQAFTIASIPIILRTLIYEENGTKQTIKIYSYLSAISAWSPAVATTIGALLITYTHWYAIFYVLLLAAVINLILLYKLLHNKPPATVNNLKLLKSYGKIIKIKDFWLLAVPFSLIFSGNAAYMSISPFQLISADNISHAEYGLSFFILMTGSMLGRLAAGKLIDYISVVALLRTACLIACLITTLALGLLWLHFTKPYLFLTLAAGYYFVIGLVAPTGKTYVSCFNKNLKTTLLGALTLLESLFSVLISVLAAFLPASWFVLFAIFLINACCAGCLLFFLNPHQTESS